MNEKENYLKQNGYKPKDGIRCYYNRTAEKIFTIMYIDDQPLEVIQNSMCEFHDVKSWKVYRMGNQKIDVQKIYKVLGDKP